MDLSIIITSFNTKDLLDQCLASIYKEGERKEWSFEVIVVDNASTDGTPEYIQKKYKNCLWIQNTKNIGFGKANNQGILKSKGKYILLLNSDTIILPGAIHKLLAFVRAHTPCFAGPKLLNADRSPQTSCGPFFRLPVVFAALFLKGDVLGITRWSPGQVKKVDWVSGACMMAPKTVFVDDLLFDDRIFMYMDEIDLLYRAHRKGYPVYFFPGASVVHVGSASSPDNRKSPILNIYRGLRLFYEKFHPGWQVSAVRFMLQCKAYLGIAAGWVAGKQELQRTYEEALRLVQ